MDPYIQLKDVGLRFRLYRNRHPNLKEAVIQRLRRGGYENGYSEFWALRNISISFEPGQRVGIIGRNGAGKSTMLRVISGIYRPTEGTVHQQGFLIPLFQVGFGFNSELTGRENVIQAGAMLGLGRQEMLRRLPGILEFAELTAFEDTPIKYYSTGMGMRLAFTTATEVSPDILLLDEVFGGGDVGFQEKALQRLGSLIERTRIVIMVSHSMEIIERFCNRAIWVRDGHVAGDGPPKAIISDYLAAIPAAPQVQTA